MARGSLVGIVVVEPLADEAILGRDAVDRAGGRQVFVRGPGGGEMIEDDVGENGLLPFDLDGVA